MGMADLIIKVVRASNPDENSSERYRRRVDGNTYGGHGQQASKAVQASRVAFRGRDPWDSRRCETNIEACDDADDMELAKNGDGIKLTIVTEVRRDGAAQDAASGDIEEAEMHSESSSTRRLRKGNPY